MAYTLTQQLNHVNEDAWDDTITSDNVSGMFIAVTSNQIGEGASQREMTVQLFQLEQAPESNTTNSGLYIRQEGETSVKATLLDQGGNVVATNVADYPA